MSHKDESASLMRIHRTGENSNKETKFTTLSGIGVPCQSDLISDVCVKYKYFESLTETRC